MLFDLTVARKNVKYKKYVDNIFDHLRAETSSLNQERLLCT